MCMIASQMMNGAPLNTCTRPNVMQIITRAPPMILIIVSMGFSLLTDGDQFTVDPLDMVCINADYGLRMALIGAAIRQ